MRRHTQPANDIYRPILIFLFLLGGLLTVPIGAEPVSLDVAMDTPVLLSGGARTAYLRIALKGGELVDPADRTPINLAIVLDRSGSMQGEKLAEAKRAAVMAVERLQPDDVVSVVTYDSTVHVLVPARRVGDARLLVERIQQIGVGGNTALFAGVSKGAAEVRRFLSSQRVNRVILLSDGLANVGPSSPGDLAELGASLANEGIAVTTIGLGLSYNELLMANLAERSDGNHYFAERAQDLERVYTAELGEVLSVVAQEVEVTAAFSSGVRPRRILGRDATLEQGSLRGRLNQLYSQQTKYFLVEVEIPEGAGGEQRSVAEVTVSYGDLRTGIREIRWNKVSVLYSDSLAAVEGARNSRVMGSVARQIGAEQNQYAMRLRDEGKLEEARRVLRSNAEYLAEHADLYGNRWLEQDAQRNLADADNLDAEEWRAQRKRMLSNQLEALQSLGYIE